MINYTINFSSYDNEPDYIEDYEEEDYPEYDLAPAPAPTTPPQPKETPNKQCLNVPMSNMLYTF